jgi:hypothetical protein
MVIDAQRPHLLERADRKRRRNRGSERRTTVHQLRAEALDQEHRDAERNQWNDDERGGFADILTEQRPHRDDHGTDGHVDQPRPMHAAAGGRVQPILGDIKPALSGDPIAHLGEAHDVVGIGELALHDRVPAEHGHDRADDRPGAGQQRKVAPLGGQANTTLRRST